MAQIAQMPHGQPRAFAVVQHDAGQRRSLDPFASGDDRRVVAAGAQIGMAHQPVQQDDAIGARRVEKAFQRAVPSLAFQRVCDQQVIAVARQFAPHPVEDLGKERVAQIGHQCDHTAGPLLAQVPRGMVHPVAGRGHRVGHCNARRLGHKTGARQHPADRRRRHTGQPRHIRNPHPAGNCCPLVHAATLGPAGLSGKSHKKMFAIDFSPVQLGNTGE